MFLPVYFFSPCFKQYLIGDFLDITQNCSKIFHKYNKHKMALILRRLDNNKTTMNTA